MNPRPQNGRMRQRHSLSGSFFVGMLIVALAVYLFVMLGGGRL